MWQIYERFSHSRKTDSWQQSHTNIQKKTIRFPWCNSSNFCDKMPLLIIEWFLKDKQALKNKCRFQKRLIILFRLIFKPAISIEPVIDNRYISMGNTIFLLKKIIRCLLNIMVSILIKIKTI